MIKIYNKNNEEYRKIKALSDCKRGHLYPYRIDAQVKINEENYTLERVLQKLI